MAVLVLKGDTVKLVRSGAILDSNGDAQERADVFGDAIPCDAIPNGAAQALPLSDGTQKMYSYTLVLDAKCPDFQMGQRVRLERANGETHEAVVLGFHRYTLQAKMWI